MNIGEVDYFLRESGYSQDYCAHCNHQHNIRSRPKAFTVGFIPICTLHKEGAEVTGEALNIGWRSVVKSYWNNVLPPVVIDFFRILNDDDSICMYCGKLEYSYFYRAKHDWCDCEQPSITELVVEE